MWRWFMSFNGLLRPTRISILLLSLVISLAVSAQTDVSLTVKPLVCQVKAQGDMCQVTLTIYWQAAKPINPCLYKNHIKETCWFNQQRSEIKLQTRFSDNVLFTLQENNQVLAEQRLSINSQAPKYRRRLRADWSIF